MTLQKNTLKNLYQKKLTFVLYFDEAFVLDAETLKLNFIEFEEFVSQNISYWKNVIPTSDQTNYYSIWESKEHQISAGLKEATTRKYNDKAGQINDILSALGVPNLSSSEETTVKNYSLPIYRELYFRTPSLKDKRINSLASFLEYSISRLGELDAINQLEDSLLSYIALNKNPSQLTPNIGSSDIAKNISSIYCLREYLFDTKVDWNRISEETIDRYNEILSAKLNKAQEKIKDAQNAAQEIQDELEAKKNLWTNLEASYTEKLKLEAPEALWNEQAKNYKRSAGILTFLTILVSLIFIFSLSVAVPNVIKLQSHIPYLSPSVILVSFITFVVYIIRVLIKQIQSAKHLQITCTERAALTRFYQALLKESGTSDQNNATQFYNERLIVYKALFEVADSGLIKNSSGGDGIDGLITAMLKHT